MFGSRRALLNKVMKGVPLTFSRVGVAYNNGVSVPANTPRFQTIAGKRGIVLESSTTNYCTANQSTGGNTLGNTTGFARVGSTETIGFDPLINRVLVQTPGTTGYEGVQLSPITVTSSNVYTVTFWVSGTGTIHPEVIERDSSSGVVGTTGGSAITLSSIPQPIIVTRNFGNTGVKLVPSLKTSSTPLVTDYRVHYVQVENKAYSTSWTLGGTTRSAETLTISSKVLDVSKGTIECEIYVNDAFKTNTGHRFVFCHAMSFGSATDAIWLYHSSGGYLRALLGDSTTSTSFVTGIADASLPNGFHKIAMTWDSTELALFVDGIKLTPIQNPKLPQRYNDVAYIGSNSPGALVADTIIKQMCISKIKRTDTDITSRAQANTYPIDSQVTAFALLENDIRGVASA